VDEATHHYQLNEGLPDNTPIHPIIKKTDGRITLQFKIEKGNSRFTNADAEDTMDSTNQNHYRQLIKRCAPLEKLNFPAHFRSQSRGLTQAQRLCYLTTSL